MYKVLIKCVQNLQKAKKKKIIKNLLLPKSFKNFSFKEVNSKKNNLANNVSNNINNNN